MRTDECPVCEQISLRAETFTDEFEYAGRQLRVEGLERSHCTNCGENSMFPGQLRANQLRVAEAKRSSVGLLSGVQIKAMRERLGLSQAEAANLFGGGANAFSKYERGEVIQSAPMDKLLRAASEIPQLIDFLKDDAGLCTATISTHEGTAITLPAELLAPWTFAAVQASAATEYVVETGWDSVDTSACANDDYYTVQVGLA